MSSRDSRYAF